VSALHVAHGFPPLDRAGAEVDYVSGAALLVRRSLFDEVGGLDERYSPGFWEDVDLCFAVRERGL
jgi:GT2 family glycosyltransferase